MDRLSEHQFNEGMSPLPKRLLSKEVRLESEQVFRLLNALEHLTQKDVSDFDIERFREDLQDACWLADWKREYVLLDADQMFIPELDALLLSDK